ncbi:EAL domain-containing protein [Thermomonas brevis]|uniref:EAL domain-containing protein n=1 Tax=Thermomonas brevis TaxID=215691 RepID=A0A7G9QUH9_9GAMM|nr:EAL domain-containing protein [Thermomonas brevis]QNN47004.1 EAL domain-containing protein [Thermomonas brevis]
MRDGARVRSCGTWRRMLLVLALLFALPPTVLSAPAPATDAPARIRVVSNYNYPPFFFLDGDGKPQGYEADIWRLFEQRTGIQVDLVLTDWGAAMQNMRGGRADVIDMLYRTPSRAAQFEFSKPYVDLPVGIYVSRRLNGIVDVGTLRGFPVGVQRGDACAERLNEEGIANLQIFDNYDGIMRAALRGDLLIFCMDQYPADYNLYRNSALDRFHQAFVLFTEQSHWAVRKGDDATFKAIERGMALIKPEERAALRKRWLEHPSILSDWMRLTGIGVAVALGVVALMALWIWTLGRNVRSRTREIQAQQDKLRALFDASPDAMWVKDRAGVYRECNERVFGILHLQHRDIIGRTDEELFAPDQVALIRRMDGQAVQRGEQQTYLLPVAIEGGTHQLEVINVPLRHPDGEVYGLLGTARDITDRLQTEAQLRLWAHAFQHAAFGVAIFDVPTQTIVMANPTFARERGYTPEELAGQPANILYPPDIADERTRSRRDTSHLAHYMIETEQVTRDGRRFPVLLDCSGTHDAEGNAQYVIAYAQDISERKQSESELRLAAAAFQTQDALVVLDNEGVIQRVNAAFTTLTGYGAAEVIGERPSMLESQRHERSFYQRMWTQIRNEGFWLGEQWITTKQGQLRVVRLEVSAVQDEGGSIRHYVCAMADLTGEREAHARAEHMALFDPLTDLPNRNFLNDRLQHLLGDDALTSGALLLIDLDHFKRINELRSHATGDRLLAFLAQRLRSLLGEHDILSRFSGGTFALLLTCQNEEPVPCAEYAPHFAERVRQALHEPFWLGNAAPINVTVSIGWTELHPGQGASESVLKEAELAMYAAKAAGRDQVRRFEPAMLAALEQQEALTGDLLNAITGDTGELDLHLQLQIDRQDRAVGAEALLRWTRPNGERVPPDAFIAFAEENGLILPLGDWVLQRACHRLARWAEQPLTRELALAINVSAKQFAQPGFIGDVRRALERSGADPARLKLEITETAILGDIGEITAKLDELRSLGIRISLDDFGTGYSSLSYLSRLPLDQLKIDRSFVSRLPEDGNDATVAQTIIGMGRGLNLEVIAEGVETAEQQDFLRKHGCDAFQGYLIARPLPLAEFEAMLQARAASA